MFVEAKVAIGVTVGTQVMVGNGASVGRGVTVGSTVGMSVSGGAKVENSGTVTSRVGDIVAVATKPALFEVDGEVQADNVTKIMDKSIKIGNFFRFMCTPLKNLNIKLGFLFDSNKFLILTSLRKQLVNFFIKCLL